MKSPIEVYRFKKKIILERNELKKKLEEMDYYFACLQSECSHSLVLAFEDHKPHKIGRIIHCFCPACGKKESIYPSHELEKSSFKDSRIVDLTKVPASTFYESYPTILDYIFEHYDRYYTNEISESEIAEDIIHFVEDSNKTYKK